MDSVVFSDSFTLVLNIEVYYHVCCSHEFQKEITYICLLE